MFSDADLLGVPLRVVVSPRNLKDNCCEISARDKSFSYKVPVEETADKVQELIKELMAKRYVSVKYKHMQKNLTICRR